MLAASDAGAARIEKVVELSRSCNAGLRISCRELFIVAKEDRDPSVRNLADGPLLAHFAKHAWDPYVRGAATRRLQDQELLTRIVLRDDDEYVRLAALWRIEDDALLARIARSETRLDHPRAKESHEDQLRRLSGGDDDYFVRSEAQSSLNWLEAKRRESSRPPI